MQAASDDYELRDFGDGRKLERFGHFVVDRPGPTAEGVAPSRPELWRTAAARYEASRVGDGQWRPAAENWRPRVWQFSHSGAIKLRLNLDGLPSGQVGVFPEQCENWDWIARQVSKARAVGSTGGASRTPSQPMRVLNLFAYTGGSTLAAAAAGAEVVHVDAAHSMVERARTNAESSGLADRPIRWIVEDAVKFCRRELKRGNRYEAVILDPPSYGHGPQGESWKIGEDLLPLLNVCGELTTQRRSFVLVTCHTPGIGPAELAAYLAEGIFGNCGEPPAAGELFLKTRDGRRLPSGVFARWPR
jgi:23S rRNA (cytosine1962-C5)-methyltransferase